MKKSLLYLTAALILGILAIIAPLLVLVPLEKESFNDGVSLFLGEGLRRLEGPYTYGVSTQNPYSSDLTVLTISFIIAMVVYLFVRHRIPRQEPPWIRMPPY
jgi:hypothetical protein